MKHGNTPTVSGLLLKKPCYEIFFCTEGSLSGRNGRKVHSAKLVKFFQLIRAFCRQDHIYMYSSCVSLLQAIGIKIHGYTDTRIRVSLYSADTQSTLTVQYKPVDIFRSCEYEHLNESRACGGVTVYIRMT